MIKTLVQAELVQQRRMAAGKTGIAKAVRRFSMRVHGLPCSFNPNLDLLLNKPGNWGTALEGKPSPTKRKLKGDK